MSMPALPYNALRRQRLTSGAAGRRLRGDGAALWVCRAGHAPAPATSMDELCC